MSRFVPFASTIWNLIRSAREDPQGEMSRLVEIYREPVVRYLRRRGVAPETAEDLVQEVFLRIFEKELLRKVEESKGKFRSFLLGVANNVLREHLARSGVRKCAHVPLEEIRVVVPKEDDRDFTREWMLHLVRLATEKLAESSNDAERRGLEVLRAFVWKRPSYPELAGRFGITTHAVKNALYETKRRLRREVGRLVNEYAVSARDFEEEMEAFDAQALRGA